MNTYCPLLLQAESPGRGVVGVGGSFQAASCFWWLPAALALPGSGPISPVSAWARGLLLLRSHQDARLHFRPTRIQMTLS